MKQKAMQPSQVSFASPRSQTNRRSTTGLSAAAAAAVEHLEARQLLSFALGVNFQPGGAPVPSGYVADTGAVYANRGNGYSYGWSSDISANTRDRNVNPDQRYDTLALMQLYGSAKWEVAVPNGTYLVHAVAGDPSFTDSVYKIKAEGTLLINGTPTASNPFVEGTATIKVTDGRLTLNNASGSSNNKLAFVDIARIDQPAVTGTPYLSNMPWTSATNGSGPVEKDMSNGGPAAGDGRMLSLGGVTYAKGMGVSANSSITYNVAGNSAEFRADIGLDDEADAGASAVFQVLADGVKVYDSGTMTKSTAAKSIAIALAGVSQLTLVVTDAGGGANDHADWANARLVAVAPPAPTAPTAPSNLTATAASASQVNLAWKDNSTNETGFKIQRSTDGATFTQIATVGAGVTTYANTGLTAATPYTYRVLAYNNAGNSSASASATATTQAAPVAPTAPAAPSNLTATAASASQINLAWTDNSTNETGFKIQRSTDGGSTFTQIATVGAGVTTYSNTALAASTTYVYRVVAYNGAGDSAATANATATTQATPVVTARFVVSTTGSDSAAGTATAPFKTVAKAMSLAQAGDTILVKNGTYHESLSLTRSGSAGKPITLMGESTDGVVFDGTGMARVLMSNGASYITVQNMTVRYAANNPQGGDAAVRTGDYWTLQDMVVEKVDGTGVDVWGSHVTLNRVTAQYNGVAGIDGSNCSDVLVKDCVTRYNNNGMANPVWKSQTTISGWEAATQVNGLWYMSPDFEAGGGKWWQTSNVTIDGMEGYGNVGPAIWFDMDSTNAIIRNSNLHDNRGLTSALAYQGAGIEIEMQSAGPILLEGNTLSNNQGAGVWLCDTTATTVRNNTFVNDNILLKDDVRDGNHPLRNDTITGNRFKNGFIETGIGTFSTQAKTDRALTIDGNTYDNGTGTLMTWADVSYNSLDTIRSVLGFEATGKVGTVTP